MTITRVFESRIVLWVLVIAVVADIFIYSFKKDYIPINADGKGYYLYLPSYVIHGDISYLKLIQALKNHPEGEYARIDDILNTHPVTGRLINKYSIGVAVLLLPFFLTAHGFSLLSGGEADGFSFPYQLAVSLAALFYLSLGIFFLCRLLRQRFSEQASATVWCILLFGTNLLYYGTYEASYSHVYSFFLFSLFVFTVSLWSETYRLRYAVLMGVTLGLITLVRVPNALMALFPIFYGANSLDAFRSGAEQWRRKLPSLALAAVIASVLFFPQLLVWKYGAGAWFINPYVDEYFDFTRPHIWGILFGSRKGLLFYSPLLILAAGGLFLGTFRKDRFWLPIIIFLAAQTYVTASWHCWWLGASWGHRGYTESLSLMSIPLGYMVLFLRQKQFLWNRLKWILFLAMSINVLAMFWYWSPLGFPSGWSESQLVRYFRNK